MIISPDWEKLRKVRMTVGKNRYTLETWDTLGWDGYGKHRLGYRFKRNGFVLFEGNDFYCSPMHAVDSDESLRSLLGFLTLRPGDTDPEYFEGYTKAQTSFAETDAEELNLYTLEDEPLPFEEA